MKKVLLTFLITIITSGAFASHQNNGGDSKDLILRDLDHAIQLLDLAMKQTNSRYNDGLYSLLQETSHLIIRAEQGINSGMTEQKFIQCKLDASFSANRAPYRGFGESFAECEANVREQCYEYRRLNPANEFESTCQKGKVDYL